MNLSKNGILVSIGQIAERTIGATIKIPEDFHFAAGQYICLAIPTLKYPDPKGSTRMFSIVSSPNRTGELDIIFRTGESGYKKTLIGMTPGSEIALSGPYGSIGLPEDMSTPVIFLAGGVGIAPFLSMIRFSIETNSGRNITLIYANARKEEAAYLDELMRIENKNFRLVTIFGLLDKSSLEGFANQNISWFVAGPRAFVNSASVALNQLGVSSERVTFEQYYPDAISETDFEKKLATIDRSDAVIDDPYLLALENSSSHFVLTDNNGLILYANKAAEKITGYTFEEMVGNTPRLWGGLMPVDFYKKLWRTIKDDRRVFSGEIKNRRKNQEEYYSSARISPILNKDADLLGFVATEEDVTERIQKDKALADARKADLNILNDLSVEKSKVETAEAKEKAILLSIGDGLIATDEKGTIILMNWAAEKLLGMKIEEVVGKVLTKTILLEDERGALISPEKRPMNLVLASGTTTTTDTALYYVRGDKTKFPTAIVVTPIMLGGKSIGTIEVFRDVTREKEIEKAKSEFISLASHQLRTPPSIIGWYTETLRLGELGPVNEQQAEYLAEIDRANQRMVNVINSLLNISRIEMGTLSISPKEIDIKEIIDEAVKETSSRFKRDAEIKKNYDPALDLIKADPDILEIVIDNLLSNAFKYSPPENTKIEIAAKVEEGILLLSVKDNGIGIPLKDKDQICEKLFRADNAVSANPDGTGLGLYMVKKIVVGGLGGKIWFDSEEGKGATFYISIPIFGMEKKTGTTKLAKTQ